MAYSLTIDGYTFDNPPESYRKHITLGNSPIPHFQRALASFYQSGQQELQFEVKGRLSLNEQNDLDELEELQQIAIVGGEVDVDFDPFFSGTCIIEDDPFRQADERGEYRFIMTVNSDSTDDTAYPTHATPTTGNTFELGSFDFGYDPSAVQQNYDRQTDTVDRLQGISQTVDTAGLVTKIQLEGYTDGAGQATLWDKARNNKVSFLSAEFQNGWSLIADLSISSEPETPHYLEGLFRYELELFVVNDPGSGIGEVTSFIDHGVKDTGTYVSDDGSGSADFAALDFTVDAGTGSLNGDYVAWDETTLTLTDNDTNWVYVTDDDTDGEGDVKFNNSGFPADSVHLYRVYTSSGIITKIEDVRSLLIGDNDADAGDSTSYKENDRIYYEVATGTSPDDPNNQETTWPTTTNVLDYNATNYLFLEDPDTDGSGTISQNTTGYPSGVVQMWRVETDGSSITNEIDDRPGDLTQSGSGDTTDSDLVFSEDLIIDDSGFNFAQITPLSDTIPLSATAAYLGLTTLSSAVADVDDSGFSHTLTSVGSEILTWETETDWNGVLDHPGMVHDEIAEHPGPTVVADGNEYGSLTDGLLIYWPMDTGSGSTVVDETEFGFDATINGPTWTTDSKVGSHCLDFDGTDDYTTLADDQLLDEKLTKLTVAVWVYPRDVSNSQLVFSKEGNDEGNWGILIQNDADAVISLGTDTTAQNSYAIETVQTGAWQHIAAVWDSETETLKGYYNGGERLSTTVSGNHVLDNNNPVAMGANHEKSILHFDGRADDARLYRRVLSQPEIFALATRSETSPVSGGDTV